MRKFTTILECILYECSQTTCPSYFNKSTDEQREKKELKKNLEQICSFSEASSIEKAIKIFTLTEVWSSVNSLNNNNLFAKALNLHLLGNISIK